MGGLGAWTLNVTSNNVPAGYKILPDFQNSIFDDQRDSRMAEKLLGLLMFSEYVLSYRTHD